jgi:3-hydroxyisobutyrate dehydrogenase
MSTIGIEGMERCAALAQQNELVLVDAPVLGTRQPAEKGELVVLAGGPAEALETCRPLFEVVGSRTLELGEVGAGTRLKLVVNHWLLAVVQGLAETIALAEAIDVDPRQFLDTIKGGGLDLPYAQMKGRAMIEGDFAPSFALSLARKDARLVLEAAERHDHPAQLARTIAALMDRAIEQGHGDEDLAAAYFGSTSAPASSESRAR